MTPLRALALPLLAALTLTACVRLDDPGDPEMRTLGAYRGPGDDCQLLGRNELTAEMQSETSDIVACPTGSASDASLAATATATEVQRTPSFTIYRVGLR